MKTTRDIRVIRTQTAILKALADLIQKKKLSAITITDLCAKANINRNTFYYHYNNIFEFLDEHKQIVIEDIKKISEKNRTHGKDIHVDLCSALKNHPNFLTIMLSPNCDMDYYSDIFDAASKVTESFAAGTKDLSAKPSTLSPTAMPAPTPSSRHGSLAASRKLPKRSAKSSGTFRAKAPST